MKDPNTVLLYPGPDAVDIMDLPSCQGTEYNLVLLDGTWSQARGLFHQNLMMKWPQKVRENFFLQVFNYKFSMKV